MYQLIEPKISISKFFIAFIIWLGVCIIGFSILISVSPEPVDNNYIIGLLWPFIAALIGVPLLGLFVLIRLTDHVFEVDEGQISDESGKVVVDDYWALRKRFEKVQKEMENLKASPSKSSGTSLGDFTVSSEDGHTQIKRKSRRPRTNSVETVAVTENDADGAMIDAFSVHLGNAKAIFDDAANAYQENNEGEIVRSRGWILESSIEALERANRLSDGQGAYIRKVLELDKKTRRSGRKNLEANHLKSLDELKAAA